MDSPHYRLDKDISYAETSHGGVILHQRTGQYWELNSVSAHIVLQLLTEKTIDQLAREITDSYEISDSSDDIYRDITAFITELSEQSLLIRS